MAVFLPGQHLPGVCAVVPVPAGRELAGAGWPGAAGASPGCCRSPANGARRMRAAGRPLPRS